VSERKRASLYNCFPEKLILVQDGPILMCIAGCVNC